MNAEPSWQDLKLEEFFRKFDASKDLWENVKLAVDESQRRFWSYETLKKAIDRIKEAYK